MAESCVLLVLTGELNFQEFLGARFSPSTVGKTVHQMAVSVPVLGGQNNFGSKGKPKGSQPYRGVLQFRN